ncbi:LytR C-terminal domain-containing protein [Actinoplanes derwentensis]|uniref:LytR cell envelope-related transcriptional attenuator n=1 Tax=Actinoplanes derwentensis TaxID=113562 RepID=A0A1H2CHG9_9ACTN|nr:LytR C-terminal domain-containing protein [Actinoplanes derwentensis]GID88721.1 hypothetical protein Ade03nite_76450 [Actinoplanes derwentensis]SDT69769.1 LytR cell envelope-related transcriptional attenuator [Actinoplanes derwentensis]
MHERLRELENDVRDLEMTPAALVRERGRRRGRRQLAVVAAAGAVVMVTAGVAFAWPSAERTVTPAAPAAGPTVSAPPVQGISCDLALPAAPGAVRVRVLDGGAADGLADDIATELRGRGFGVTDGPAAEEPADVIVVTYGPTSVGAAHLLRAVVYGEATMRFDPDRRDRLVDLTIGPAFDRLATATELNQNLVEAGEPSAPPECR